MTLKYRKIGTYELFAIGVILFAAGLRLLLLSLNWPPTNSDEGVMGIMALHIAYHGEHPLIFYGQDYMGTSEAYLAALCFHLLGGPSLFALRLGVVLLVTLFFICMYFLTSIIFSKRLALITIALLSVGSIPYLTRQMLATGGSAETLFFGSFSFLLVIWLSLSYDRSSPPRLNLSRLLAYFSLGLAVGLALWSDMVVLPILAMAGILLLIFCWRSMAMWLVTPIGIAIGLVPSLRYSYVRHLNPLVVLLDLFHGLDAHSPTTLHGMLHGILATILVSIPTATGNPFCPVQELGFLGDSSDPTLACNTVHAIWGFGYLALLALALFLTLRGLWQLRARFRSETTLNAFEKHRLLVRQMARLMLLGIAVSAIAAFAISSAPTMWPGFHARYLIVLLVALPAVIEPLVDAVGRIRVPSPPVRWRAFASSAVLALFAASLLVGTCIAFSEVPAAQKETQHYVDLGNHLISLGVKNVKSDYWSCYNITFLSKEQLLCDVMTGDLHPGYNRPPTYNAIVMADPHAAYVFKSDSGQYPSLMQMVHKGDKSYRHYFYDGYDIYIPV